MVNVKMVCRGCGVELNDDNWWISLQKRNNKICIECKKKCNLIYRNSHKKEAREYSKNYSITHKDIIREYKKQYNDKLRKEVLGYYSNNIFECACCGESHIEFLGIDHVNGGGFKHRKNIKRNNIYFWLKSNNFPSGFRVLCYNCNLSLGFYGYCPHDKEE